MRPGQAATMKVDAYPNVVFSRASGKSIAWKPAQVFSLLPAENATGNWVKVVPAAAGSHRHRQSAEGSAVACGPQRQRQVWTPYITAACSAANGRKDPR